MDELADSKPGKSFLLRIVVLALAPFGTAGMPKPIVRAPFPMPIGVPKGAYPPWLLLRFFLRFAVLSASFFGFPSKRMGAV